MDAVGEGKHKQNLQEEHQPVAENGNEVAGRRRYWRRVSAEAESDFQPQRRRLPVLGWAGY